MSDPLDESYFLNNYNTQLSPDEEKQFQEWVSNQSVMRGRPVLNDQYNYDLKGYWKENGATDKGSGHMTDKFKKPNHPSFSVESIYHNTPSPYGQNWQGGQWGEGTFQPSDFMLQNTHDPKNLQDYFQQHEPDVRLLLPELKGTRQ